MIPPDHRFEVDEELWGVLDICSNEELEEIYKILYGVQRLMTCTLMSLHLSTK